MPDRELRHMSRTELIEIIFALKQSEDQLKAENAALTAQLEDRRIHIEKAGSIAQAALELNKVFAAAQAAADEYVASVRALEPQAVPDTKQAQAEAAQILAQAQQQAEELQQQTDRKCKAMLAKAEQEVQARWAEFDRRASEVLDNYQKIDFLPEDRHTT